MNCKFKVFLSNKCTLNHPFYVKKSKYALPEKIKLGDLQKGYYIGSHINNKSDNPYNLSNEDCWILGRYIADGHIRKTKRKNRPNSYIYQCILSIGKDKLSEVKKNIKEHHYSCYPHSQSVYRIVFSSKNMVDFIQKMGFGQSALEKTIPNFILDLPIDKLQSFLDGYMTGDGCVIEDKFQATTISRNLAMMLTLVIQKVHRVGCRIYFTERPKKALYKEE